MGRYEFPWVPIAQRHQNSGRGPHSCELSERMPRWCSAIAPAAQAALAATPDVPDLGIYSTGLVSNLDFLRFFGFFQFLLIFGGFFYCTHAGKYQLQAIPVILVLVFFEKPSKSALKTYGI